MPTVSSNVVTFPTEAIIDARAVAQTITYTLFCKINDAIKVYPNYATTQTNTCSCSYRQGSSTGTLVTVTKTLLFFVNHPNIILNLGATDLTTNIFSYYNLDISANSSILFNISMENNSLISLVNGKLEIPIDSNYIFYAINNALMCDTTDSFKISIPSALLPYTLYIDGIKITDVPAYTAYSDNLDIMKNPPNGTKKTITIQTLIPSSSPFGTRYDFTVTVASLTYPYPSKTVLNMDPN